MKKLTKKDLMEKALSKFSDQDIQEAKGFGWSAVFKGGFKTGTKNTHFTWNQKDRKNVIKKDIRGGLLNTKSTEDNKKISNNTSSDNILKISIVLKKD